MSFLPLTTPPDDPLLASLEALIRRGIPELTGGVEWTGDPCPAGHWLLPAGAHLYRWDTTAKVTSPGVILSFWKDAAPRTPHDDRYWLLYPMVELLWPRDLTTLATQQLRTMLQSVLTADMGDPVPALQQRALDRLSLDPAVLTPGLRVLALRDVLTEKLRDENGHPVFTLSFQILASGIQPAA